MKATPRSRRSRSLLAALMFVVGGLALPQTATADDEGVSGRVTRLRINTPGSEQHPSFLGAITIKQPSSGDMYEYRWGGSSCPGQKLTEAQIDVLLTAFVQRNRTLVTPRYTMGEGVSTRCLVAFELAAG